MFELEVCERLSADGERSHAWTEDAESPEVDERRLRQRWRAAANGADVSRSRCCRVALRATRSSARCAPGGALIRDASTWWTT